jgi:hypothetical protein
MREIAVGGNFSQAAALRNFKPLTAIVRSPASKWAFASGRLIEWL